MEESFTHEVGLTAEQTDVERLSIDPLAPAAQEIAKAFHEPVDADDEPVDNGVLGLVEAAVQDQNAETAILPRQAGTPEDPIGTLDPAHPVFWHGRNIMGVEYQGSAVSAQQAIADSLVIGTATCHTRHNPDYKDPNPVIAPVLAPDPAAASYNAGYRKGYDDADAAYQDLKALCLAFGNEQAAATSDDVEQKYPFVAYARFNR